MEIVRVEAYSFAHPSSVGEGCVLEGVSLRIEEGAFCLLAGDTGTGKTTLLRSLKPELAPVGQRAGDVWVCGRHLVSDGSPTDEMSQRESVEQVGFVAQDPDAQIVCDTVWHELAFGLENIAMPPDKMRRRVAEAAHFFGIEPWVESRCDALSGGQKQLVNLAAALAARPRLLLLDEPTAQLDPAAAGQFLALLARVNRELGVTVVMATHASEQVEAYATQRIDLNEPGPRVSLGEVQAHLASSRALRSNALAASSCALELREVYVRFQKTGPWVLRGVNVRVRRGGVHVLVGGNGCGKTTLLRTLAGAQKAQRGRVINPFTRSQALLPQDPKTLFVCDSVSEELAEWQNLCGYTDADISDVLCRFGLEQYAMRHSYDLSGGQQQMLALAKLLLCKPELLLMDEPTKGLDAHTCAEVVRIIGGLAREGCTIVVVTHDLDFAYVVADEVSMLFDGQIVCTEAVCDFFDDNAVYRPNRESRLFAEVCRGTR